MNLIHGPDVRVGCAEYERSAAGVPHIQGFVHLLHPVYLNQILAALGARAQCEVCVGDDDDNFRYCSATGLILVVSGVRRQSNGNLLAVPSSSFGTCLALSTSISGSKLWAG
jgi:hypothetical protein